LRTAWARKPGGQAITYNPLAPRVNACTLTHNAQAVKVVAALALGITRGQAEDRASAEGDGAHREAFAGLSALVLTVICGQNALGTILKHNATSPYYLRQNLTGEI
jgi:hypothetical protein